MGAIKLDLKKNIKILVVEDHEPNILVASLILDELGYGYDIARNSREALNKIGKAKYSLILMDVRMAGRDGIETTKIIRSAELRDSTTPVPIIALTADGDKERCLEAGMDDYIMKPITLKILKEKINSNLD